VKVESAEHHALDVKNANATNPDKNHHRFI
jgi:hypothetical protein